VYYSIEITNFSEASHTYQIAASSIWPVHPAAPVGPVKPGETKTASLRVDIPKVAKIGDSASVTLTVTPQTEPDARITIQLFAEAAAFVWLPVIQR
jgi:hypothetical protein